MVETRPREKEAMKAPKASRKQYRKQAKLRKSRMMTLKQQRRQEMTVAPRVSKSP